MTPGEVAEWLDEVVSSTPDPKSGEETYRWLHSRVERVVKDGREELIGGLRIWLRSESNSVFVAKLAADFHLIELRSDLLKLIGDIEHGQTQFPAGMKIYYANLFADYLSRI